MPKGKDENPMAKFQRQMLDMGLGVSIQINEKPPVDVTVYCESCKVVALPHRDDSCPNCGTPYPAKVAADG